MKNYTTEKQYGIVNENKMIKVNYEKGLQSDLDSNCLYIAEIEFKGITELREVSHYELKTFYSFELLKSYKKNSSKWKN